MKTQHIQILRLQPSRILASMRSSTKNINISSSPTRKRRKKGNPGTLVITTHSATIDTSKKSPMELINEVPPIKVEGWIVACEGDSNPALGHPIEFICLDLKDPAICKYCGLRYVQHDHHH